MAISYGAPDTRLVPRRHAEVSSSAVTPSAFAAKEFLTLKHLRFEASARITIYHPASSIPFLRGGCLQCVQVQVVNLPPNDSSKVHYLYICRKVPKKPASAANS